MSLKHLLLAPLVVLLAWMLMAFFVVREPNVSAKKEQLTLGSIGEPDDLNPIISQTTSAAEVEGFIFNGLLKYDEHLDVVGDVAEDFRVTQDSTAFFAGDADAAEALRQLNASQDKWPGFQLQSCTKDGARLLLEFGDPNERLVAGTDYETGLFEIIDRNKLLPATVLTLTFDPSASFADGNSVTPEAIKARLAELDETLEGVRIHEMLPISDSLMSISLIGQAQPFVDALPQALAGEKGPVGEVMDRLTQALLNEPVIRFQLRRNVRWQDGAPVTSADAAFTFRCILDPQYRSPRASDYWLVKRVETPDEHTFVVIYRYPYSECLLSWMMSLLPKHVLDGRDAQWWADNYNLTPIGTGPYRIVEWQRNEVIRLEANPDYFEGPPNLPAVAYRLLPDPFVNQAAFEAGGFDTNGLLPYQVQRYESDKKTFQTFRRWGEGYVYIGWNLKRPMFADKLVRQALAQAVNIERIIRYVYRGYARQANGTYPFQMWYANKDLQPYPYDPQKAREALAQAGWTDTDGDGWLDKDGRRFEFTLIANQGNTLRAAIQALVQDDLRNIGIKVNTAVYEWAVFIKNYINTQEFDACVLGWSLGYSFDQFQLWHSSQIAPPGLNFCSYSSPEADELLQRIRTTFDRRQIARLCGELQEVIYHDQPYLFIAYNEGISALYRGKYVVRRPAGDGQWTVEPIRQTDAGFGHYMSWWAPRAIAPQLAP